MNVWYSFLIAFAMYSRIPVPTVEWTKERMRYVFCFFLVIGILCGAGVWLWLLLAGRAGFSPTAAGLIGTAVPVILTGGIHMDGFLDTVDALSSYGDREKKLEILKDPHTGAFAVTGGCMYLLCYGGLMIRWAELVMEKGGFPKTGPSLMLGAVFVMERAFSGLSVASFPCAKGTGLAYAFADSARKTVARSFLTVWLLACAAFLIWQGGVGGGAAVVSQTAVFFWYYRMAKEKFGGITGDLAGWFLQVSEMAGLFVLTVGGKI